MSGAPTHTLGQCTPPPLPFFGKSCFHAIRPCEPCIPFGGFGGTMGKEWENPALMNHRLGPAPTSRLVLENTQAQQRHDCSNHGRAQKQRQCNQTKSRTD